MTARKTTRRQWLHSSIGIGTLGPAFLVPKPVWGYSVEEIDKKLRFGASIQGVTIQDLPTPSLIIDIDKLQANIDKMAQHAKNSSINLRPHSKTHKCPEVARRQIKAGALGLCTATIYEAETMTAAGIKGLLITSELVGPNKIHRLVRLTKKNSDVMAVVDNPMHAEELSAAAVAGKVDLNILVDINPIGRRTGIEAGQPALDLAKTIDRLPNLKLRGVHCYSGASSHVTGFETRKQHSEKVMGPPLETFQQMKRDGLPVEIMSGSSTGTYNIDTGIQGITEMQVGSYVFMDVDYRLIGGHGGEVYDDFQPALTVLGTVISKNHEDRATLDAGIKAFATDRKSGPEVIGISGVGFRIAGDEHGVLTLENPSREIRLGDKFRFIVPHCDPNVNLYDRAYCVRGENVVEMWKIEARGHV